MDKSVVLSRVKASAELLGQAAEDSHRFENKPVLLTGEEPVLLSSNGQISMVNSLRLLSRITTRLDVLLPPGARALHDEMAGEIQLRCPSDTARLIGPEEYREGNYAAFLNVGHRGRPDLPWTVVNSDGWLIRIASDGRSLDSGNLGINPIAALAGACLGVGDVFKRLVGLRPERGCVLSKTSFSLHSYTSDTTETGPDLPAILNEDIVLAGAGAIGNGIIELLKRLKYQGRVFVIDNQSLAGENVGTYLLVGERSVGGKAAFAEGELRGAGVPCRGFCEPVEHLESLIGESIPFPRVVLTALDNIPARHNIQRAFWSDLIIDGAIGAFACQVGRHPWAADVGCLICSFQEPFTDSVAVATHATGLSRERVQNAVVLITEADVAEALPQRQEVLRARIGRPACAVIEEAIAEQISSEHRRNRFQPSVPFVACFSACMVIAELVRFIAGESSPLSPRFQFDFLVGPGNGQMYEEMRRPECICVSRRAVIQRIRQSRGRTL